MVIVIVTFLNSTRILISDRFAHLIFEKQGFVQERELIPQWRCKTSKKIYMKGARKNGTEILESKWKIECKKENRTIMS